MEIIKPKPISQGNGSSSLSNKTPKWGTNISPNSSKSPTPPTVRSGGYGISKQVIDNLKVLQNGMSFGLNAIG